MNNKGHGPTDLAIILMLPGLIGVANLYGALVLWICILWVPISIVIIYKRGKK